MVVLVVVVVVDETRANTTIANTTTTTTNTTNTTKTRESSYVTSSKIIKRDYLENRRTCLPREQPREQAGVREKVLPEAEEPQKGQL